MGVDMGKDQSASSHEFYDKVRRAVSNGSQFYRSVSTQDLDNKAIWDQLLQSLTKAASWWKPQYGDKVWIASSEDGSVGGIKGPSRILECLFLSQNGDEVAIGYSDSGKPVVGRVSRSNCYPSSTFAYLRAWFDLSAKQCVSDPLIDGYFDEAINSPIEADWDSIRDQVFIWCPASAFIANEEGVMVPLFQPVELVEEEMPEFYQNVLNDVIARSASNHEPQLDQQLTLDLGEEYADILKSTSRFVYTDKFEVIDTELKVAIAQCDTEDLAWQVTDALNEQHDRKPKYVVEKCHQDWEYRIIDSVRGEAIALFKNGLAADRYVAHLNRFG